MTSRNRVEILRKYIDRHPLMMLFTVAVVIVSGLLTIGEGISNGIDLYNTTFAWRKIEERKINQLSAGVNIEKFKEVLGIPLFIKKWGNDKTEYMFRNSSYWVQAVTDNIGAVHLYAIVTCDKSFTPTIYNNPAGNPITLGKTAFSQIVPNAETDNYYYFIGNTAPTYFIEEYYGGNPSRYQTIYWGLNDICDLDTTKIPDDLYEVIISDQKIQNTNNPVIRNFRNHAMINMFAVTSIDFKWSDIKEERFLIGGNRVETRIYNQRND